MLRITHPFWALLFRLAWILLGLSLLVSLLARLLASLSLRCKVYFRLGLLTASVALVSWSYAGNAAAPGTELVAALWHLPLILGSAVLIWQGAHDGDQSTPRY